MKRALLGVALAAAALAGPAAALAQTAAAPEAGTALPAAGSAAGPIAALQQQLKQEGFAPGPVNGVMTEETRRALVLYQRRRGRPPEGADADPVRRAQAVCTLGLFTGPPMGSPSQMRDAIIRFEAARRLASIRGSAIICSRRR